jgi:hypothetical protein
MESQEQTFQQKYANLLAKYQLAFPSIEPPAPHWWSHWLGKYSFRDIADVIESLSHRNLKSQITTESTGRAISSLLRDRALRRAIPGAGVTR